MIVLGSNSKARYQLLKGYNAEIEVISSNIDETFLDNLSIYDNLKKIALDKANDILLNNDLSNKILICADTIVLLNNKVLLKPKTYHEAYDMIKSYCNNKVEIITGVSIHYNNKLEHSFYEKSYVIFDEIDEKTINEYLSNNDYLSVAGALCIEKISDYINFKIEGSMSNIIGLPMEKISYYLCDNKLFKKYKIDQDIIDSCNVYRTTNRCFLLKEDKVYLMKCLTLDLKHTYYCSVGGGYHYYEDKIEALQREVLEESGYNISDIKYICYNYEKVIRNNIYHINKLTINNYYVANMKEFLSTSLVDYELDTILGIEGFKIDDALCILEKQIELFKEIEPEYKISTTDYKALLCFKKEDQ